MILMLILRTYGGVRKTMPKTLFSSSLETDMTSAPVFLCLNNTAFDLHSPINSSETFSNPYFSATSSDTLLTSAATHKIKTQLFVFLILNWKNEIHLTWRVLCRDGVRRESREVVFVEVKRGGGGRRRGRERKEFAAAAVG